MGWSRKAMSLRKILSALYMDIFKHEKLVLIKNTLADTSVKTENEIEIDFKLVRLDSFPKDL